MGAAPADTFCYQGRQYAAHERLAAYPRERDVAAAYELGQRLAEQYDGDLTAAVHSGDLDHVLLDDLSAASWDAGFYGRPKPVWATGWRFGNIPENGRSYNYRDNQPEPGVSMMWVRDAHGNEYATEDALSAAFISRRTKRVEYSGWLVGFGSDGEPCLLR